MNTARKLILLFSLLAVAMTAANSLYFYNASIADLDRSTQQSLDVISSEMLSEVEQYVSLMGLRLCPAHQRRGLHEFLL